MSATPGCLGEKRVLDIASELNLRRQYSRPVAAQNLTSIANQLSSSSSLVLHDCFYVDTAFCTGSRYSKSGTAV